MSRAADLPAALAVLASLDPVGVDVERADWDRYWRTAALIQIGGGGHVALIDPLAIDDLGELDGFLCERLVVLHAMENDLVPLAAAGVVPPRVADTAVAAGLLGLPTGLADLLDQVLDVRLAADKQEMQRADWEARPIDPEMLQYAAADVAHLPELWERLHAMLVERGRLSWYEEEVEALRALPPAEERRHWQRVKGIGRLGREAQGRARALWEARERLGKETDTAPGRIVADKILVRLAEEPPPSRGELARRGMRRQAVRRFGDEVMAALRGAAAVPPRKGERRMTDADRKAAEQLREIRAGVARDLGIDPGVLCPSRTLPGAVMSDPETPEALQEALGLRAWQWRQLGSAFCATLGLDALPGGTAPQAPVDGGSTMADVLDQTTLDQRLQDLDGWAGTPSEGISKTYRTSDFNGSVAFLNRVAELADEADHHPDVAISWDKVTLTYLTHSKGGVTDADLAQARAIDERLGPAS